MVKYCAGTNKDNDKPCKKPAMRNSEYCNMHDPERSRERILRARRGAPKPHTIVGKLKDLKIKDTSDMAIALKKIIEDILRTGRLNTASDINVFNGLVKTAVMLEQNSEVPKKLREIEGLLSNQETSQSS